MEHFDYAKSLVVITDQDIIDTLLVQGQQLAEYNLGSLSKFGHQKPEDEERLFELRVTPQGQVVIAFVADRASEHYVQIGNKFPCDKHMALKIVGGFTIQTAALQSACYLQLQRRGGFNKEAAHDLLAAS